MTNNLFRDTTGFVILTKGILLPLVGLSGVLLGSVMPRPIDARGRWAVAGGILLGAAILAALFVQGPGALDPIFGLSGSQGATLGYLRVGVAFATLGICVPVITLSLRAALGPPTDHAGWVRLAVLTASPGLWVVWQIGNLSFHPTNPWSLLMTLLLLAGIVVPWLVAGARTASRFATRIALGWAALGLLAYLYLLLPANDGPHFFDVLGVNGILRVIGWSLLVYAILRADLLGVPLPHFVVRRGAVAGTALATLFIVAQIAQNFLSAEYGLLTGGIVAGAFLFAASPFQRAMERLGEGRPARSSTSGVGSNDDAYRAAMRLAFRDRRLSQEEELSLADLAERLGIGARRATEIRHQIEHEKGVA